MSFLWYDSQLIQAYLEDKRQCPGLTENDLGHPYSKKFYKLNQLFSPEPLGMIHDISGHVPHPLNVITRNPYEYYNETRTFGQVCLDTAKKIADHTDRPLIVTWSGGIDSTSVLVAMLQTVPWDRITVVCSQRSINEYPELYKDIIKPHLKTIDFSTWFSTFQDYFTVSGDAGDTVWAVIDNDFYQGHHESRNRLWSDWIDQKIMPDLEFVEEFRNWSQVNIKTVLDLRAWFYLCCKWQDKSMKFFTDCPGMTDLTGSPFYDFDNSFRAWTMNNLDKIIADSWKQYKMPAKQFIHDFHPCDNYLQNKTKEQSVDIVSRNEYWKLINGHCRFAIDENYVSHGFPSWPFLDMYQLQDFNKIHNLIPMEYLCAKID